MHMRTEAKFKRYISLAEKGNAQSQYDLGRCYFDEINSFLTKRNEYRRKTCKENATEWFRKAAEQGHSDAQFYLGECYSRFEENEEEAVEWYRKAANQGNARGQCGLGCYYGDKRKYEEALKWYRKAADQGDATACYNLANYYRKGQGVKEDRNESMRLCLKAAEKGHVYAQCDVGDTYGFALLSQPCDWAEEKKLSEAMKWWRKAADQKCTHSQVCLGRCYEEGKGVTKDLAEALKWFEKALEIYVPHTNRGAEEGKARVLLALEKVERQKKLEEERIRAEKEKIRLEEEKKAQAEAERLSKIKEAERIKQLEEAERQKKLADAERQRKLQEEEAARKVAEEKLRIENDLNARRKNFSNKLGSIIADSKITNPDLQRLNQRFQDLEGDAVNLNCHEFYESRGSFYYTYATKEENAARQKKLYMQALADYNIVMDMNPFVSGAAERVEELEKILGPTVKPTVIQNSIFKKPIEQSEIDKKKEEIKAAQNQLKGASPH